MSYQERKIYRAKKKAGKYRKKSYIFNFLVALSSINILGSYASIFISPKYFFLSVLFNICIIVISFNLSSYCEDEADSIISEALKAPSASSVDEECKDNNIIEVDFKKRECRSYIDEDRDEII